MCPARRLFDRAGAVARRGILQIGSAVNLKMTALPISAKVARSVGLCAFAANRATAPGKIGMARLRKILIVGGGTAGWLTANYLASTLHAASQQNLEIALVESPDIGILGVGEGTFPSIRGTLAAIGLDEARFLRCATATFK